MGENSSNSQGIAVQPTENLVQSNDGGVFTTSLIIAEAFDKNHYDVLKAISNLECSAEFNERNFAAVEYKDAKGELRPAYRITRDGFSFLAMGFTGKKAAAWKEKFLEAFNAMERALTERHPACGAIEFPPIAAGETNDEKCVRMVRGYCAYWALVDKMPLPVAELSVCARMGIDRLEDITVGNYAEAMKYLMVTCYHPTFGRFDAKADKEKAVLLWHMLSACAQFKYSQQNDFKEYFEHLTGARLEDMLGLTHHDVEKMLHAAGGLLHRAYQHTLTTSLYMDK